MSEEEMMNYISGFPTGWRPGDTLGVGADQTPTAPGFTYQDTSQMFPGLGLPEPTYGQDAFLGPVGTGGYQPPDVASLFPGLGDFGGGGTDYSDLYQFGG